MWTWLDCDALLSVTARSHEVDEEEREERERNGKRAARRRGHLALVSDGDARVLRIVMCYKECV